MSDDDIDLPLDEPEAQPMVIKCGVPGCPSPKLTNLGYRYVHTVKPPYDQTHEPEPVEVRE